MTLLTVCYEKSYLAPQLLVDNVSKILEGVMGNNIKVKVESPSDKKYSLGCIILRATESGRPEWVTAEDMIKNLKSARKIVVIVVGEGDTFRQYSDKKNWLKIKALNSKNLTVLSYDGDPSHLTPEQKQELKRFIEGENPSPAKQAESKPIEVSKAPEFKEPVPAPKKPVSEAVKAPAPKEPKESAPTAKRAAVKAAAPVLQEEKSPSLRPKLSLISLEKAIKESAAMLESSKSLLESAGAAKTDPKYSGLLPKTLREHQQKGIDSLKNWGVAIPRINVSEQDVDALIKNQEKLVNSLETANKTFMEQFKNGDYLKK